MKSIKIAEQPVNLLAMNQIQSAQNNVFKDVSARTVTFVMRKENASRKEIVLIVRIFVQKIKFLFHFDKNFS